MTNKEDVKLSIGQKLANIQQELKAPKSQWNKFGKFYYRNCEDILEGLKPLLLKYNTLLTISDEIIMVGDRIYVKATANLVQNDASIISGGSSFVEVSAFARESLTKKGMDESQITGTASSYARKYALNGMFAIDDANDSDSDEDTGKAGDLYSRLSDRLKKVKTTEDLVKIQKEITDSAGGMGDENLKALRLEYSKVAQSLQPKPENNG